LHDMRHIPSGFDAELSLPHGNNLRSELSKHGIMNVMRKSTSSQRLALIAAFATVGCGAVPVGPDATAPADTPIAADAGVSLDTPTAADATASTDVPASTDATASTDVPASNDVTVNSDVPASNDVTVNSDVPASTDVTVNSDVPAAVDVPVAPDVPTAVDVTVARDVPSAIDVAVDVPPAIDVTVARDVPPSVDVTVARDVPATIDVAMVFDAGTASDVAVRSDVSGAVDAGVVSDRGVVADAGPTTLRTSGRRLLRNGVPIEIRGVCWSPVARGATFPPDYLRFAETDARLMQAAGINAVRTYTPILDRAVLDILYAHGIGVLMTVYAYGGAPESEATDAVRAVMNHPAILMWLVGNEWNYNGLFTGVPFVTARDRLQRIAAAIHVLDPGRPVSTVYGELPSSETIAAMPAIDVWGLNVYRNIGFGDLFTRWAALSGAPMFISEYGADAWDSRGAGMENVAAQAEATTALTQLILNQSTARRTDGVTLGGTIFEWSDEWWKDQAGSLSVHDVGGVAPGGGPYPDNTFNEEWWGVVTVDRVPRPAYDALSRLYRP
jgi:Glycosyl hydrolases family 2, TIM barrel domain